MNFSEEVLKIVTTENSNLKTMLFDMSLGLPFKNNSINAIVADLSLHYFSSSTTKYILDEIYRVLKNNGYLIGRVNSTKDKFHIPNNAQNLKKTFIMMVIFIRSFLKKTTLRYYLQILKFVI